MSTPQHAMLFKNTHANAELTSIGIKQSTDLLHVRRCASAMYNWAGQSTGLRQ